SADNLISQFESTLPGNKDDLYDQAKDGVFVGQLPVGALAAVAKKPYAEAWIRSAPGFLPIVSPLETEQGADARDIEQCIEQPVVIEASTLRMLAELDQTATWLLGQFESVSI